MEKKLEEIRGSIVESWGKVGKNTKKVIRIFGDEMKIVMGVWVKEVTRKYFGRNVQS